MGVVVIRHKLRARYHSSTIYGLPMPLLPDFWFILPALYPDSIMLINCIPNLCQNIHDRPITIKTAPLGIEDITIICHRTNQSPSSARCLTYVCTVRPGIKKSVYQMNQSQ